MAIENILKKVRPELLELKQYTSARSLYDSSDDMIFLDANECPFEPYVGAELLSRYPSQQPKQMMEAMCRLYDVSSRNILTSRGADEAIEILIKTFCTPYKSNIIICPPTFPMYAQSAKIYSSEVREVPLNKGDFSVDIDGIINISDDNSSIIFLCSPNNPTANLTNIKTVKKLCEYFSDKSLIIVDETYLEFTDQKSFIELMDKYDNLVILRTLSKAYAGAGLRCGVAIAHAEIIKLMLKILPPYPVPAPVMKEVIKILTPENIKKLDKKRQEIMDLKKQIIPKFEKLDCIKEILPSETNFFLVKVENAAEFCKKCLKNGIIVRDQSKLLNLENSVRISIGSPEQMDKLLAVLKGTNAATKKCRTATITRSTKETSIAVKINLDETSPVKISTGIGFYDHMLEQIAKHGGFSLELECEGDLEIDEHHTIEDCAIALGQALKQALGDKRGIGRYGFTLPMDEANASVSIDLSGRFFLKFDGKFPADKVGDLPTDMTEHIFRSIAENLQANCHIEVTGDNAHHMVEACFKAFGRTLKQAIKKDGEALPSTKGIL